MLTNLKAHEVSTSEDEAIQALRRQIAVKPFDEEKQLLFEHLKTPKNFDQLRKEINLPNMLQKIDYLVIFGSIVPFTIPGHPHCYYIHSSQEACLTSLELFKNKKTMIDIDQRIIPNLIKAVRMVLESHPDINKLKEELSRVETAIVYYKIRSNSGLACSGNINELLQQKEEIIEIMRAENVQWGGEVEDSSQHKKELLTDPVLLIGSTDRYKPLTITLTNEKGFKVPLTAKFNLETIAELYDRLGTCTLQVIVDLQHFQAHFRNINARLTVIKNTLAHNPSLGSLIKERDELITLKYYFTIRAGFIHSLLQNNPGLFIRFLVKKELAQDDTMFEIIMDIKDKTKSFKQEFPLSRIEIIPH